VHANEQPAQGTGHWVSNPFCIAHLQPFPHRHPHGCEQYFGRRGGVGHTRWSLEIQQSSPENLNLSQSLNRHSIDPTEPFHCKQVPVEVTSDRHSLLQATRRGHPMLLYFSLQVIFSTSTSSASSSASSSNWAYGVDARGAGEVGSCGGVCGSGRGHWPALGDS